MTGLDDEPARPADGCDVPPSLPRLALLPTAIILYGLVTVALRLNRSWLDGLIAGSLYLVIGIGLLGYRWRRRRRPVLRIDSLGVINGEGHRVHSWPHTAQVWVGPTPGRWIPVPLRFPTLVVWTAAGVEFGRRARHGPTAALNIAVPTGLSADQLAAVVRRFTDAPVLTADEVELADLTRRLLGPGDRE